MTVYKRHVGVYTWGENMIKGGGGGIKSLLSIRLSKFESLVDSFASSAKMAIF